MPPGRPPHAVPPARYDEVRRLYESGQTQVEIAAWLGVSRVLVSHILRRKCGVTPRRGRPARKIPPAMFDEVLRLYESGLTQQDIATRLGVSAPYVGRILRYKCGMSPRPHRPRQPARHRRRPEGGSRHATPLAPNL